METVKTGDILFFCNNTGTGFLLRNLDSMMWNHVGIAVRILPQFDEYNESYERISLDDKGELYILEINTGERVDVLTGDTIIGAGFSSLNIIRQKYNYIGARNLHDKFRNKQLAINTIKFIDKYRGFEFTKGIVPFLSVWLGMPLAGTETKLDPDEMFCSELCANYYKECIGPLTSKITGREYNGDLNELFGAEAPKYANLYSPRHYTWIMTPNSTIFKNNEKIVYHAEADICVVLFQPIVIIFAIIVLIAMTLRNL